MQITPEDLLREAADMALELRLKDRAITGLETENKRLQEALTAQGGHGHTHSHGPGDEALSSPDFQNDRAAPDDGQTTA